MFIKLRRCLITPQSFAIYFTPQNVLQETAAKTKLARNNQNKFILSYHIIYKVLKILSIKFYKNKRRNLARIS